MNNQEILTQLTDRIQGGDLIPTVQAPPKLAGQLSEAYTMITANNSQGGNRGVLGGVNIVGVLLLVGGGYLALKALR